MGIVGIVQGGALRLGGGDAAPAFEAPPLSPEHIEEAVRPQDAGLVLATWSQRDGLPAGPDYLVSTRNGMLLFAGQDRIHRFDGNRFSPLVGDDGKPFLLDAIMGAGRGQGDEVWYRTRKGEVARIGARGVQRFGPDSGLPAKTDITRVLATDAGTFAATCTGVFRLGQGRWTALALPGIAGRSVFSMESDGRRAWAIVDSQLRVVAGDFSDSALVRNLDDDQNSGLVGDAQSGVWYWQSSGERNLCRLDAGNACYRIDGMDWPSVAADGTVYWVDGTRVLRFDPRAGAVADGGRPRGRVSVVETGLPLDEVLAAPGGVLWLIAGGRLARLAPTPVERVPVPEGAIVPASGHDVWVGAFGVGMLRVGTPPPGARLFVNEAGHVRVGPWPAQPGRSSRALTAKEAAAETRPVVLEVYDRMPQTIVRVDALGGGEVMAANLASPTLWIGSEAAGWRPHPSPPLDKASVVRGIARDADGGIILGAMRDPAGLFRFDGSAWTPLPSRGEGLDDVVAMHVDRRGRIWLGSRGTLLVVDGATTTAYGPEQGLAIGAVRAIEEVDGAIWAVGGKGVARFRDNGFDVLHLDERIAISGMTGMAMDDDGTLWLGAAQGIARVSKEAWSAALGQPGARAPVTLLGEMEGVEHPIVSTAPLPTVTRTADGRIWFYTLGAMYRIDPRKVPPPGPAPPMATTAATVAGTRQAAGTAMKLPAGARRLVFGFHALAPVVPERTAFRSRAPGLDDAWREMDGDRVVLDRLPPGDYTFELQSSTEDGAWSGTTSAQAFSIPPTFWQSIWSKLLLALAIVALTATGFMLRARQLEARRRALVDAKLEEREKIARDMHDTLLQGVTGLLMTMQAAVTRMDDRSAERERLEGSIGIAERILEEGRDRVSALRTTAPGTPGLARALQAHARDLAYGHRILCEVQVLGEPVPLVAAVEDEMVQVGREALANAFVHARASRITLCIDYGASWVRVEVGDDGVGMQAPADGREHWGIQGMQERAAAIAGQLEVHAGSGGGAPRGWPGAGGCGLGGGPRVVLRVPARSAYGRVPAAGDTAWARITARVRGAMARLRGDGRTDPSPP